jgi:cytochrome o ubiquinol oxidase subunit 2
LEADKAGTYPGSSANISGKGFAGMKFAVKAMPDAAFNTWVHSAQQSSQPLDARSYNALAAPSYNNKPAYYGGVQPSLYDTILMKYMMPIQTSSVPDVPAGKTTREAN